MNSPQFMSQLTDQTCPLLEETPILLQQTNPANRSQDEHDFFFVLDICEHFKNYTERSDCKTYNQTMEVINDIKIEVKISHEFFNVKSYVLNGYEMFSEFMTYQMTLNKEVFQRQAYKVAREGITWRNSYLVNWSFMAGKKITAYTIEPLLSTIFPYTVQPFNDSSNPKDVFLSMHFTQADT